MNSRLGAIAAVAAVLGTSVSAVAQERIEGSMRCVVQSNDIIEISEGRARSYSGFTDQFETGDTLTFLYSLRPDNSLFISLRDEERDQTHAAEWAPNEWRLNEISQVAVSLADAVQMYFGLDFIGFETISGAAEIRMERYYRSDWMGIGTRQSNNPGVALATHVFTFDCRHIDDRTVEVFEALRSASSR